MLFVLLVGCKIELFIQKQFKKTICSHNFLYFVFLAQKVCLYSVLAMRVMGRVCQLVLKAIVVEDSIQVFTQSTKMLLPLETVMWFKCKFQELMMISQETPDYILEIFWGTLDLPNPVGLDREGIFYVI